MYSTGNADTRSLRRKYPHNSFARFVKRIPTTIFSLFCVMLELTGGRMNIAITGATGFLGSKITGRLRAAGHGVRPISIRQGLRAEALQDCEAVIHVAGEPVAQRWTKAAKERIRSSRVEGTRALVNAVGSLTNPPRIFIGASAVGYYGSRGDEILTESTPPAD